MDRLRVAVIGAGAMANAVHYPSLAQLDCVELVGIADLDEERLRRTGDTYSIACRNTDYRRMLEAAAPDAVFAILRPHHLFDVALHCLQAGLHLFTEKPPGVHALQTRQLAAHAERHGCLTMVGFNRRFIPVIVEARRQVEAVGPIHQCMVTFQKKAARQPQYYDGASDVLRCDAVHAVDALRWLGGEVSSLASTVDWRASEHPNAFNALMRFKDGAVGILNTNWACGKRTHWFEFHAVGISAYVDGNASALICRADDDTTVLSATEVAGSEDFRVYYGYHAQAEHFVRSVLAGVEPAPSLADATKTMALCERILASDIDGAERGLGW